MLYSEVSSPASAKSQKSRRIVKIPCDRGAEEVFILSFAALEIALEGSGEIPCDSGLGEVVLATLRISFSHKPDYG